MLKNTIINRRVIKKVAIALGELNEQVIYVGGAAVSLYINDQAADDVRPTKDIDISLSVASIVELENLRQQLIQKGFIQSAEDNVICRFRYEGIKVDVMNTKAIGWAPANPWFAPGFHLKQVVDVENKKVYILPISYFLASKFVAFNDRGALDPRISHDFEDITYILDNRMDLVDEVVHSPDDVRNYLQLQFEGILKDGLKKEAITGNLFYETMELRYKKIIENLNKIVKSA